MDELLLAIAIRPAVVNFDSSIRGEEDCLFLNVFSPRGASKLPVVVWIRESFLL